MMELATVLKTIREYGDPDRGALGALCGAWQDIVEPWMNHKEAERLREKAPELARQCLLAAKAYAQAGSKTQRKALHHSLLLKPLFHDQRTRRSRELRLAWINAVQGMADAPKVESTKDLPWTWVLAYHRWLTGDHPAHREWTEEQVETAREQRVADIWAWLDEQ